MGSEGFSTLSTNCEAEVKLEEQTGCLAMSEGASTRYTVSPWNVLALTRITLPIPTLVLLLESVLLKEKVMLMGVSTTVLS